MADPTDPPGKRFTGAPVATTFPGPPFAVEPAHLIVTEPAVHFLRGGRVPVLDRDPTAALGGGQQLFRIQSIKGRNRRFRPRSA